MFDINLKTSTSLRILLTNMKEYIYSRYRLEESVEI